MELGWVGVILGVRVGSWVGLRVGVGAGHFGHKTLWHHEIGAEV